VYTIRMVELFNQLPQGNLVLGELSIWFVILFYAVLFALTFGGSRLRGTAGSLRGRVSAVSIAGGLVFLSIALLLVWRAAVSIPDRRLHITFLDVGSAEAVLIQTPTGQHILINGGSSVTALADELGRRLPAFDRNLDWLIVAATEEEDVAALPRVIERYPPGAVLWSGNRQASFSSRVLTEYLTVRNIRVTEAEPEQVLSLGQGATLRVLTTGPRGAVLLVEWEKFRALLPVGMSFEALDELREGAEVGPVSVLSLADSGYAASNPPEWIANLNPELVLLNVSAADEFGMPDASMMELVEDYEVMRTDRNGWVEVATDGSQMWVNVERK
jgi:competence protein ComEC